MARNRARIGSLRASFPPSHMPGLTKAWTYGLMMTLLALMISSRGKGRCPIFGVPRGRREVLVTSVGDATPDHVAVLPGNTALLLVLSAAIGGFVLLMLAGPYWLAALALLPVAALILLWVRAMVPASDMHPIAVAPPACPFRSITRPVPALLRPGLARFWSPMARSLPRCCSGWPSFRLSHQARLRPPARKK